MQGSRPEMARNISEDQKSMVSITHNDFTFVNYINSKRFFGGKRPFSLIQGQPSLESYSNVIYTPSTRAWKPFDGCLYNEEMVRIETSCIRRGRNDTCLTMDSHRFEGNPSALSTYDRPLLYLGYVNPHYGHFLLETLSRWWALTENIGDFDRYLIHVHHPSVLELPHIQKCLSALQIDRDRLVHFYEPTELKNVVIPEASFQIESHVFGKYRELCEKVVTGLAGQSCRTSDQPLYVSRRLLRSGVTEYRGEAEVEAFLSSRGVKIVHPQQLPFEEQVRIFNEHRQIWGLIGSGMHNIIFSIEPKSVIYLTPDQANPSCFLIDKCFGASSVYMQSCSRSDQLRWLAAKLLKRMRIERERKADAFIRTRDLDYKYIISWFTKSGYC